MTAGSPSIAPAGLAGELAAIHRLIGQGRRSQAGEGLKQLETTASTNASAMHQLGEAWLHCGRFEASARCYARAAELAPGQPDVLYNLAAARVATGEIAEAERLFSEVIRRDPGNADAWQNRSSLRAWTEADNHIEALRGAVAGATDDASHIPLCFALAKELEDLERSEDAFGWLRRGCDLRRRRLSYRVEDDLATMADIARVFTAERLAGAPAAVDAPGPIFVLGLPRSGTTLVDRILSSLPQVESLGEIPDFALALVSALGPVRDKAALVRMAGEMDHAKLGRAYLERVQGFDPSCPLVIDKTPANYLYVGLIALALPQARIVHVRRDPMDVGYALYKTLFRSGAPYSYDLDDLGRYIVGQQALMAHWRAALPGRMIEIDYEALTAEPEAESRALLAACGLDWDPACLDFHSRRGPAATASAAQVRRPIHRQSVGLWHRYETQLAPLRHRLQPDVGA